MDAGKAVRYALDNFHRWYPTNIHELRSYLEYVERNRNPVTLEVITKNHHYVRGEILLKRYIEPYGVMGRIIPIAKAKECYQLIDKEWNYPDWMMWLDRLVSFWESTHPYRKVKNADLTIGEWFKLYGLEVPDILEERKNNVITTYTELKITGIISDLDLEIKKHLGIEDRIENALKNFDDLSSEEKAEISILVYSSDGYNHPYAQLLRERLERDKLKNGEKDPDLT